MRNDLKLLKFPSQDEKARKVRQVLQAAKLMADPDHGCEFQQIFLDALGEAYNFDEDFYADTCYRKIIELQEWIRQFWQRDDDVLDELLEMVDDDAEDEEN